jgi:CBS domain-containing protein
MFIRQILSTKGGRVIGTAPATTIAEVVGLLERERIGAVVVTDEQGRLAGILSERDVACGLARHGPALLAMRAEQIMTAKVITCAPDDRVDQVMQQMTAGRFRHVPVLEDGAMVGIISIGDVVKSRLEELEQERSQLQDYIVGAA